MARLVVVEVGLAVAAGVTPAEMGADQAALAVTEVASSEARNLHSQCHTGTRALQWKGCQRGHSKPRHHPHTLGDAVVSSYRLGMCWCTGSARAAWAHRVAMEARAHVD